MSVSIRVFVREYCGRPRSDRTRHAGRVRGVCLCGSRCRSRAGDRGSRRRRPERAANPRGSGVERERVARPDATPYPRRWRARPRPEASTSPTALNTRRLGGVDAQGPIRVVVERGGSGLRGRRGRVVGVASECENDGDDAVPLPKSRVRRPPGGPRLNALFQHV